MTINQIRATIQPQWMWWHVSHMDSMPPVHAGFVTPEASFVAQSEAWVGVMDD
jgi:hypothetical protein